MASKKKINLLPKDQFEFSTTGQFVQWAVSVGRWIVVLTEFVVICAFLSRFYFDTQLANLFDEVKQKTAIVASAASFEENFRQTQDKIKIIKGLLAEEKKPSGAIVEISKLLPLEVMLTRIGFEEEALIIEGAALSDSGLRVFLAGLIKNSRFSQVALTDVSSRKEGLPGISFSISAIYEP
ncbi:MAG TPA: PilN domain-containing protein [Clostridia bacterium]|nr:PilN domain-containing protein [Clostridia bacterium]